MFNSDRCIRILKERRVLLLISTFLMRTFFRALSTTPYAPMFCFVFFDEKIMINRKYNENSIPSPIMPSISYLSLTLLGTFFIIKHL